MKAPKTLTKTTDSQILRNLNKWWDYATPEMRGGGVEWYSDGQAFCQKVGREYGLDPYLVASVLSALSPKNKWERNKRDTVAVIDAFVNDIDYNSVKVCTYGFNKLKAFRMLREQTSDDPWIDSDSAPKTHSFAMNVGLLSEGHITVDRWHLRACLLTPKQGVQPTVESCTVVQYRRVEHLTVRVANQLGVKGYVLQATVWIAIKSAWGR